MAEAQKTVKGMCRTRSALWDSHEKRLERGQVGDFTPADFKTAKNNGLVCDPNGDIAEEVLKSV